MKSFILLLSIFAATILPQKSYSQVNPQDSLALVALYNSTNGSSWVNCNFLWLQAPVSHWYGITVDSGRVTEIFLGGFTLGTDCELTGTIPPEIGNLTKLKSLDLSDNNLTGNIPVELFNLPRLENLILSINNLSGQLSPEIGNLLSLKTLYLSNNNFYGQLPSEICNLVNLTSLSISNNAFSGKLPNNMGNLVSLDWLILSSNNFIDTVPLSIINLTQLNAFSITNNKFSFLHDLSSLYNYNLRYISIDNNSLTFEDIEPYIAFQWDNFSYVPQDSILNSIDTIIQNNVNITLSSFISGFHNKYQWKKNGNILLNDTNSYLTLNNIQFSDSGIYTCTVTNTLATLLTLNRKTIKIKVSDSTQGHVVNGNIKYFNSVFTPVNFVTVNLLSGSAIVATSITNVDGYFSFTNISDGNYTLKATTTNIWGSVTSADALKIKRHIVGLELFTESIILSAADVNNSSAITATDILKVQRRIAGLSNSFIKPDWIFESQNGSNNITVNGSDISVNIFALCAGDVDRSNFSVLKVNSDKLKNNYTQFEYEKK